MEIKYLNIYNDIMDSIENKNIKPGEKLPSENELMEKYNVSRDTIRKSLDLLEGNGYIHKIKGKGSFVLDVDKLDFPITGIVTFKELSKRMGVGSSTLLHELDLINPDKFLVKKLELSEDDLIWRVIRSREIDNKKIILDKDYFNSKYIPTLTEEICQNSIYEYIEKELGLNISFAKKEITVQRVSNEDKEYLDLEDYDMIVVVKSYTYLDDASLFQYTESRHRPDKFRFVDFARRKNY
ncbi:MAG TPA: trehalose operon repressor [Tissierellales bacterium]|nr:trehalose operon repressor [Tissierellales bacterium]